MQKKYLHLISASCFALGVGVLGFVGWRQWGSRFFNPQSQPESQLVMPTPSGLYTQSLRVGDQSLYVELADTGEKRQQGLSGRLELLEGYGMLFIFERLQPVSFWMPDMHFPIDMLFIKSNRMGSNHEYTNEKEEENSELLPSLVKGGSLVSNERGDLSGEIVFIHHKVPNPPLDTPREQLEHYAPDQPVDMVLEVPAGWSEKYGVEVGDKIMLNKN